MIDRKIAIDEGEKIHEKCQEITIGSDKYPTMREHLARIIREKENERFMKMANGELDIHELDPFATPDHIGPNMELFNIKTVSPKNQKQMLGCLDRLSGIRKGVSPKCGSKIPSRSWTKFDSLNAMLPIYKDQILIDIKILKQKIINEYGQVVDLAKMNTLDQKINLLSKYPKSFFKKNKKRINKIIKIRTKAHNKSKTHNFAIQQLEDMLDDILNINIKKK